MRYTSFILGVLAFASGPVLLGCGGGGGSTTVVTAPELPGAFALVGPDDEAVDVGRQPRFSWQASPGGLVYELTVAVDDAFTSPVATRTLVGETSCVLPDLLPGETSYVWRVAAMNEAGTTLCTSARSFTTSLLAPPVILSQFGSSTVPTNESADLTVQAAGTPPLTYTWQTPAAEGWWTLSDGSDDASLTIPPGATNLDGLRIRCLVTNADGEAVTTVETLHVRRVVRVAVDGTGDGSSWDQAADLHALIGLFSHDTDGMLFPNRPDTDEVWVAEGTWHALPYSDGRGEQLAFQIPAGVALYGGFAGNEALRVEGRDTTTHRTVLDGRLPDFTHVAPHTVTFGDYATLGGVTVRGGFSSAAAGLLWVFSEGSPPRDESVWLEHPSTGITVHDCLFEDCTASWTDYDFCCLIFP